MTVRQIGLKKDFILIIKSNLPIHFVTINEQTFRSGFRIGLKIYFTANPQFRSMWSPRSFEVSCHHDQGEERHQEVERDGRKNVESDTNGRVDGEELAEPL